MIHQLKAVIGFQEEESAVSSSEFEGLAGEVEKVKDVSKTKVEDLTLSNRITTALTDAGIKTVAGLSKKTASALKELDGVGDKAIEEIEVALKAYGTSLKGE